MKSYKGYIKKLEPNEVFVFGSNLSGFHGAGSAGYATFNEPGNVWRNYNYDTWPNGTKGKWNVKGIGEGFQIGTIGKSYALPTVTKAGMKRSRTLKEIKESIEELYNFAKKNPQYIFYIAQENKKGLNGYYPHELAEIYKSENLPDNVYFEEEFLKVIQGDLGETEFFKYEN